MTASQPNRCCGLCKGDPIFGAWFGNDFFCTNPSCECHKVSTPPNECDCICHLPEHNQVVTGCGVCGHWQETTPPSTDCACGGEYPNLKVHTKKTCYTENPTTDMVGMEWQKEFFERFGANKIWVTPSRDNVETILEIHSFISSLVQESYERGKTACTRFHVDMEHPTLDAFAAGRESMRAEILKKLPRASIGFGTTDTPEKKLHNAIAIAKNELLDEIRSILSQDTGK